VSLIRTVHKFGYAFGGGASVADHALQPAQMSRFALFWDSREIVLREGETVLGRDPDATIRIDDDTVSRHHARIHIQGETATVEDLESKNGTRVSGQRVARLFTLSNGDHLELGSVKMTFRSVGPAHSTISVPDPAND